MPASDLSTPDVNSPSAPRGLLRRGWPWAAAVLSGVLLSLCFAPWNFGRLAWIALTPLICAVWFSASSRNPGRRGALLGYVTGIVFFTCTFYWLGALGTLFGSVWLRGLSLLLSVYMGLYFAFWGWILSSLGRRPFSSSAGNLGTGLIAAAAWVAHEWVRGWLFSGFGWNNLGVTLHRELPMIQIADLTGIWGLSFLLAFFNVMAVVIVRRIVSEIGPMFLKRVRWEFSVTMAVVAGVFAYGVHSLLPAKPSVVPAVSLRIAALQPNIPQAEKFSAAAEDRVLARLDNDTGLAAALLPDLVLWPESALPRGLYADEVTYKFVLQQASRGDFALLTGSVDADLTTGEDFNAAMLLTNHGKDVQTHRKMHLVPFGEYLPLRHSFPLFAMVAGDLVPADFTPGKEYTVMELKQPAVKFSPLICFEDTLGDLTRRFVKNGAQLLINVTNDGWFLKTAGAEQHLANAVLRTVENRRPMVRCANTGVTCFINTNGAVDRGALRPFQKGMYVKQVAVAQDAPLTFYTRFGDWLAFLCAGVTAIGIGFGVRRSSGALDHARSEG